jgi:hypothetical protein
LSADDLASPNRVDCRATLSRVQKQDSVLMFTDRVHFLDCADCLDKLYEKYNDDYESLYPNATASELDSMDLQTNFNEWLPMIQFEQSLSFMSLRNRVATESDTWLNATPANLIDFTQNPDRLCPIIDEATRTLYNVNGFVKIGDLVEGMSRSADLQTGAASRFDDCAFYKSEEYDYDRNNTPLLEDRKLETRIQIRSGLLESDLKGKVTHFERNSNGKYKKKRATMSVRIAGVGMSGECSSTTDSWIAFDGPERRKTVDVKTRIWLKWREAHVKSESDTWPINRCGMSFNWEDKVTGALYLKR